MAQKTRFDRINSDEPRPPVERKRFTVVVQKWEETEAGWGCRPDGYSVHLSEADREAYVKDYWDWEKKRNPGGQTPHEYERPDGDPYLADVDEEMYEKVKATKNGARFSGRNYPGNAGRNGWMPLSGGGSAK